MLVGIDFSFGGGLTTAEIIAAKYTFVCRYLSGGNSKDIDATEVANYKAAHIPVVFVWETTGQEYTEADGVAAAKAAEAELKSIGADGATVFFAQDIPVAAGTNPVAYMKGVNSVIGLDRSGSYGNYSTIKSLFDAGVTKYGWQTSGGSNGAWDTRALLRQVGYQVKVGPATVDINQAAFWTSAKILGLSDDFGQWPRPGSAPVPATPAPVAPHVVTGLKATSVTETSARISWDRLTGATSYHWQVFKGTTAVQSALVAQGESAVAVAVTGLTPGTQYSFRIEGNGADDGWDELFPFKTLPTVEPYPAPTGLKAESIGLRVTWNPVAIPSPDANSGKNAEGYTVQVTDLNGSVHLTEVVTTNAAVLPGLAPGGTYKVTVWANGSPVAPLKETMQITV